MTPGFIVSSLFVEERALLQKPTEKFLRNMARLKWKKHPFLSIVGKDVFMAFRTAILKSTMTFLGAFMLPSCC